MAPAAVYADPEWTPAPGQACHICDDCGRPFERKAALRIHVSRQHERPLSAAESRFQIFEPDEVTP